MNFQVETAGLAQPALKQTVALRVGALLENAVFISLLLLLMLGAAAYGGSDPWVKSLLTSLIFAVGALAAIEFILTDKRRTNGLPILFPIVVLVAFSLMQTIPSPRSGGAALGITHRIWNAISADPYETKVFALQLIGLALFAGLLFRYLTTKRRLSVLLHTIVGIVLVSALFGLLRQTTQHKTGFLLPLLQPDQGYGQFINRNHFAYLMEIGLGLVLGLVAAGGVRRQRLLVYLAAFLPIWTALVLANSRGGILAMLVQLVATLLLFSLVRSAEHPAAGTAERLLRSSTVRVAMIGTLLVGVLAGVLWVGGDRLANRFESAPAEYPESEELREGVTRMQIWRATIRMIEANPIVGVGMAGYWAAIPEFHEAPGSMTPQQAHNDYLELLASGGILGLALVSWFGVLVLRQARLNLRSPDRFVRASCFAALIAIIGIGAHSLVDFGLHRMANAMIFAALIVIATCNLDNARSRQSEDA